MSEKNDYSKMTLAELEEKMHEKYGERYDPYEIDRDGELEKAFIYYLTKG